jgi:hypothetical protein
MDQLLLSPEHQAHLAALAGTRVRQLVWDLNAIYFVGEHSTLKVEALSDRPPAPDAEKFDEAAYIAVEAAAPGEFENEGAEGYWYRVLARDVVIERLELVRAYIGTPGSWLIKPGQSARNGGSISPVDCGVLITTPSGVLPAVQLGHSFGFFHWPETRFFTRDEVQATLNGDYEILPLSEVTAQ